MRKIYSHKGFEIAIELEEVEHEPVPAQPTPPEGYLAAALLNKSIRA